MCRGGKRGEAKLSNAYDNQQHQTNETIQPRKCKAERISNNSAEGQQRVMTPTYSVWE